VEMIAAWIHELSEGCPRVAIELSQHLVDSGVARYESGSWVLPVSLSGLNLPEDLGQAIRLRIAELSPRARTLAEGLSLCVEGEPLVLEEYPALLGVAEPEETFGGLNELVAAHVLVGSGSAYAFVHDAMRAALEHSIPVEARGALHRRLAEIYRSSQTKPSIVAAHHLLCAGDEAAAFGVLARFTAERDEYAVRGYRFLRSPEGGRLHESLLDWGFANGAPIADLLRIGMQMFGIASLAFGDVNRHAPLVMAELERETGLVYWDEFSHLEDPAERIRACVARAADKWAALPMDARALSPQEAISVFSSCTTHLTGLFSRTHQIDRVVALQPNIDRLSPISPAVGVAADTVRFSANARRGYLAGELRLSLIARTKVPVPGLTETTRFGLRLLTLYYQGLEEAVLGNPLAFARADELEADAPYTALGWQLRTVAHLYQGQEKRGEACRRKRDVALAGQSEAERHVEAALSYESSACVILGDLTAVKRVLPALRECAAANPGWLPHCIFVEGAHEALRGDLPKALELMYRAAELITPLEHHAWLQVENKLCQLLIELRREPEARERARRALEMCAGKALLPPYVDLLGATLALAEARLGDSETARERVAECVRRSEARGGTGILALDLYGVQARVALAMKDAKTFGAISRRVAEMCASVDSKAFAARLSALFRMSVGAGFEPVDVTAHPFRRRMTQTLARLRTELELCAGATERATRSLGMVLQQSGVLHGYLYLNQPEGFVLAASRSAEPPPIGTEEWLFKWLRAFQVEVGETETTSEGGAFFGERYRLVALVTDDGGSTVAPAIVVIDCEGVQPKVIPEYILRELANVLVDAGDVPRQ
jgi:hypothetical protein